MTGATGVLLARAAWGVALATAPDRVLGLTQPDRPDTPVANRLLRVLGVRHLLQAGVEALAPAPAVHYLGAAADGLHALSGIGLAVLDRRWRRAALIDSAIASALGLAAALTAGTDRRP
jgi:hypothetical protein